jgi:hypothetical protein
MGSRGSYQGGFEYYPKLGQTEKSGEVLWPVANLAHANLLVSARRVALH